MSLVLDGEDPLWTEVRTRDGRPARLVAADLGGGFPLAAIVDNGPGGKRVHTYTEDGRLHYDRSDDLDLVNDTAEPVSAEDAPLPQFRAVYGSLLEEIPQWWVVMKGYRPVRLFHMNDGFMDYADAADITLVPHEKQDMEEALSLLRGDSE